MSALTIHSDEHFMKQALAEAEKAFEAGEIPVGAVVVCKNRIIARAHNQVEQLNDVTAHAEMLAITAAENTLGSKYLEECALYVTLEPCAMCAGALFWSKLSKVCFGASDEKRGYRLINPKMLHAKTTIKHGLMAKECSDLVTRFFHKMRGNNS